METEGDAVSDGPYRNTRATTQSAASAADTASGPVPTRPPSLLASAAIEAILAVIRPMERVGMNPREWFAVANLPGLRDRGDSDPG